MMSHDESGVDVASARNSFNKMIDLVGPIKALEKVKINSYQSLPINMHVTVNFLYGCQYLFVV